MLEFKTLCKYYKEIEDTTKRLENIASLANLFCEIKEIGAMDDLPRVIYLTQGNLYPNWQTNAKLGIAEKLLVHALTRPTGRSVQEIRQAIIKSGDIGFAAEQFLSSTEQTESQPRKNQANLEDFLEQNVPPPGNTIVKSKKTQKVSFAPTRDLLLSDIYANSKKLQRNQDQGLWIGRFKCLRVYSHGHHR